jgi:hypothetical protein
MMASPPLTGWAIRAESVAASVEEIAPTVF